MGLMFTTKRRAELARRIDKVRSHPIHALGLRSGVRAFRALGVEIRVGTRRGRGIELHGAGVLVDIVLRQSVEREIAITGWRTAAPGLIARQHRAQPAVALEAALPVACTSAILSAKGGPRVINRRIYG